jgi:hypothetical protein
VSVRLSAWTQPGPLAAARHRQTTGRKKKARLPLISELSQFATDQHAVCRHRPCHMDASASKVPGARIPPYWPVAAAANNAQSYLTGLSRSCRWRTLSRCWLGGLFAPGRYGADMAFEPRPSRCRSNSASPPRSALWSAQRLWSMLAVGLVVHIGRLSATAAAGPARRHGRAIVAVMCRALGPS